MDIEDDLTKAKQAEKAALAELNKGEGWIAAHSKLVMGILIGAAVLVVAIVYHGIRH